MVVTESKNDLLVNELQLGVQLNECVHESRRSHFSLMLAMLTDDVRDHAQFMLPKTEQAVDTTDEDSLRKLFNVNQPVSLGINNLKDIDNFNQADLIENDRLSELRLRNALTPNPLTFRDDVNHIDSNVLQNTSVHCQQRALNKAAPTVKSRLDFRAKEWLNVVSESMLRQNDSLLA